MTASTTPHGDSRTVTTIEQVADWAAGLAPAEVPEPVVELCRAQRRLVLGAVAASSADPAARRVLTAVAAWASEGPAPLLGSERRVDVPRGGAGNEEAPRESVAREKLLASRPRMWGPTLPGTIDDAVTNDEDDLHDLLAGTAP